MLHTILRKLMSAMLSPPSAIGDRSNTCELISVPKEWSSEIISDTLVHHFIQDCGAKSPRDLWFTRQSNCGGSKTSVMQNMYTVYLLYIQFQVCRTFLVPHKFTILQAFLRLALTCPKYLQVSPFLTAYSFGYFLRVPAAAQTQQQVDLCTENCLFRAAVPSGASTGIYEAAGKLLPLMLTICSYSHT